MISYHQSYEVDEMRLFIRKKSNPVWLVYAIDKSTNQVAGFYIGRRNNVTLNSVIKTFMNAKAKRIFTDKLKNYKYLIPKEIHEIKRYGTNRIERKNLNLRTHLKRFNRKNHLFSRNMLILNSILKIYFWCEINCVKCFSNRYTIFFSVDTNIDTFITVKFITI